VTEVCTGREGEEGRGGTDICGGKQPTAMNLIDDEPESAKDQSTAKSRDVTRWWWKAPISEVSPGT